MIVGQYICTAFGHLETGMLARTIQFHPIARMDMNSCFFLMMCRDCPHQHRAGLPTTG